MRTSNDVDLLYTAHCDNLQHVHRMKYSHRNDCGENIPTLLFFLMIVCYLADAYVLKSISRQRKRAMYMLGRKVKSNTTAMPFLRLLTRHCENESI